MKADRKKVLLFGGTTEGRLLAGFLEAAGCPAVVCVATEYGRDLLLQSSGELHMQNCRADAGNGICVRLGRMNQAEMEQLFREMDPGLVIDATHPYAAEVTQNIKRACRLFPQIRLLRCERETEEHKLEQSGVPMADAPDGALIHVPDMDAAAIWLSGHTGNVLVTTGSKELAAFCGLADYRQRVYVRVLPSEESIRICRELGYEGRHIIAMQGPFSQTMNMALLREYDCRYMVTKDGGKAGGLDEKLKAAGEAGVCTLLIDRPDSGKGISLEKVKEQIKEWMDHET